MVLSWFISIFGASFGPEELNERQQMATLLEGVPFDRPFDRPSGNMDDRRRDSNTMH